MLKSTGMNGGGNSAISISSVTAMAVGTKAKSADANPAAATEAAEDRDARLALSLPSSAEDSSVGERKRGVSTERKATLDLDFGTTLLGAKAITWAKVQRSKRVIFILI